MKRFLPLLLIAWLGVAAAACGRTGSSIPSSVKTPTGDEVSLSCPLSFLQQADPTTLAELQKNWNIKTPLPTAGLYLPGALTSQPGSLDGLLLPDPSAAQNGHCALQTNEEISESNSFASAEELGQLGRLCGCEKQLQASKPTLDIKLDLYGTSTGAAQAYKMQKAWQRSDGDITAMVSAADSIGHERMMFGDPKQPTTGDWYSMLFRRRNVIVHLYLDYGYLPDSHGPPDPLLQYAAQLDRNIEAAAKQGG